MSSCINQSSLLLLHPKCLLTGPFPFSSFMLAVNPSFHPHSHHHHLSLCSLHLFHSTFVWYSSKWTVFPPPASSLCRKWDLICSEIRKVAVLAQPAVVKAGACFRTLPRGTRPSSSLLSCLSSVMEKTTDAELTEDPGCPLFVAPKTYDAMLKFKCVVWRSGGLS